MRRVPLAWSNLTHDRVRFGLFVLGIAFAVILMFVQLGFRNALLDSNTQLHDHLRADLVMVSPTRQMMAMKEGFPRRRLAQARAVAGVREVHALYIENALGMLRDSHPDPTDRSLPVTDYVEPLGKRLLIRKDEARQKTRGGIVLPDQAEIPTITGRVVEISGLSEVLHFVD